MEFLRFALSQKVFGVIKDSTRPDSARNYTRKVWLYYLQKHFYQSIGSALLPDCLRESWPSQFN